MGSDGDGLIDDLEDLDYDYDAMEEDDMDNFGYNNHDDFFDIDDDNYYYNDNNPYEDDDDEEVTDNNKSKIVKK